MQYDRARYYSSTLHRFISEDPIGFAGGINSYSYTANDPVNFNDPSGLARKCNYCGGSGWQGIMFRGQPAWLAPSTGKIVDIHGKNIGWGAEDVMVTAADDVAGMNANQLAERLTVPPSDTFTVIEFPTPAEGLASPVNRLNPGFVGRGRTFGLAREFVVPNGPIPPGATIRIAR